VLVFIALINTIISLYYYLLIVKAMFLTKSDTAIEKFESNFALKLSLVICTVAILAVGLFSEIYSQISGLV
jgi:NADH-quinone oxidoreductase subunit N